MGAARLIVALLACGTGGFKLEPVGMHQQQLHEYATRLPDKELLPGNPYTMTMLFSGRRSMARRRKRNRKRQESAGSGSVLLLMVIAIVVVLAIIFLTVLEVLPSGIAAVLAMTLLAAILFLMWLRTSAPARGGQRRKRRRKQPVAAVGPPVIDVPAVTIPVPTVPTPRVPLPPRPVRAARRRREYISYPVVVGGGDYADTYIQVDKDTVLKLRNEMTPDDDMAQLPGRRLERFPDPQAAAAAPVAAEATPVVAEPVVAEPLVVAVEPVVEEAEVDFDWE
tara:strand:- start:164 stop:1003 length:840 start_codon:yes stop_codon:yes gene_type:complete